ncbi:MAG TPA: hypothetical protein VII33_09015, partial [Nakamurella sp.]
MPEFGPNDWFVEEKYQQFLADPESVDLIWRDFFADSGSGSMMPNAQVATGNGGATSGAPASAASAAPAATTPA